MAKSDIILLDGFLDSKIKGNIYSELIKRSFQIQILFKEKISLCPISKLGCFSPILDFSVYL